MWKLEAGFLVIGFWFGWTKSKELRRGILVPDCLFQWQGKAPLPWRRGLALVLFDLIQVSGIVGLSVLNEIAIQHYVNSPAGQTPLHDTLASIEAILTIMLAIVLLVIQAFRAGGTASDTFVSWFVLSTTYTLTPNGVYQGRYFFPWSVFSHFTADSSAQSIRLGSALNPRLVAASWNMPDPAAFVQVTQVLRAHLPDRLLDRPIQTPVTWVHRRGLLPGILLVVVLPLIAAGIMLATRNFDNFPQFLFLVICLYYIAAILLVPILGNRLRRVFRLAGVYS